MAARITDKLARDLEPPATGNRITYDTEIAGFGIRLTAAGVKAFVLNYRIHNVERRYTIGRYPEWSVRAARERAAELRREVNQGRDPLGTREEARSAPTMAELFERYASQHLPRKAPRSAADDRSMWLKIILPHFGNRKVASITHAECDQLHRDIARDRPVRANRVIEVLRKAMNLAVRWGWRGDNPASGVHRSREEARERYLLPEECSSLLEALTAHPERGSATAIELMLLTGCRRGEALSARWEELDLAAGVWTKPSAHTKQRKVHRAPLSDAAIRLLRGWRDVSLGEFVFPGRSGQPLTDVKRTWETVCRRAGLTDIRLHDLRHTHASILASNGESLPTIGKILGHTQAQTTLRYSHLVDERLRNASNRAAASIMNAPK